MRRLGRPHLLCMTPPLPVHVLNSTRSDPMHPLVKARWFLQSLEAPQDVHSNGLGNVTGKSRPRPPRYTRRQFHCTSNGDFFGFTLARASTYDHTGGQPFSGHPDVADHAALREKTREPAISLHYFESEGRAAYVQSFGPLIGLAGLDHSGAPNLENTPYARAR